MTEDLLFSDVLPAARMWAVGMGSMLITLAALLVQRAARDWLHQNRTQNLRQHVSRVDGRWRQPAT